MSTPDLTSPLSARERRERIWRLVSTSGLANVDAIADMFGVTASTIRRDLTQLSASGRIARTYGGAIATSRNDEQSLAIRSGEAFEQKQAIATWAVEQISPGDAILLDAGSTVALVAQNLPANLNLHVVTPSLAALNHVHGRDDLTVHCLGGRLRPTSDAFVGPATVAAVERMRFDVAFLGADSVLPDGEVIEADMEQTYLKELMARRSNRAFVLAHASKLGQQEYKYSARIETDWTLVTDWTAGTAVVEQFRRNGVEVVVVPEPQSDEPSDSARA